MAYVDVGRGDPIVFLHGNPTSYHLWRNVIPHLAQHGRCIAPDLIGMGDSDKLPDSGPGSYRFIEHRRYLDAFLDEVGVRERVTFVVHDGGSALGFDWANRHRDAVSAIAYMEAIVRPVTWEEWPQDARRMFQAFCSVAGEAPFRHPGEDRRPTLTWPREVPIDGEPADVCQIVTDYGTWLAASPVPKRFINADPGAVLTGPQREWVRSWRNQQEVTVPGAITCRKTPRRHRPGHRRLVRHPLTLSGDTAGPGPRWGGDGLAPRSARE